MAFYLQQKQIQDYLDNYYNRYKKRLSFQEAVIQLHKQGADSTEIRLIDSESIDFSNNDTLIYTIDNHPIDITPIVAAIDYGSNYYSEDFFPFHDFSIRCAFPLKRLKKEKRINEFFSSIYVLKGYCELTTSEGTSVINENQFVIIPPKKPIFVDSIDSSIVFSITIRKSTFDSTFFHLLKEDNALSNFFENYLHRDTGNVLIFNLKATDHVRRILKNIYIENNELRMYAPTICMNYMEILFSEVLRNYDSPFKETKSKNSVYNNMAQILTYIRGNYKGLTLAKLAEHFNYESNYLGRNIKLCTGMSFNDIITEYRLNLAASLLKTTSFSIEFIAEHVGYNATEHFSRAFKKYYNCSPSIYRKEYQIIQ